MENNCQYKTTILYSTILTKDDLKPKSKSLFYSIEIEMFIYCVKVIQITYCNQTVIFFKYACLVKIIVIFIYLLGLTFNFIFIYSIHDK